ncbi:MAG: nucleotide exchange factor GrpE [Candidatus Rokubacteria bacterium]|nr:nucleotide exchange factor GrpE [Candidatus Rokubacteria bacterium]
MSDELASQDDTPVEQPGTEAADLPAQIIEEELTRLRQALEAKTREAEATHDRYLRALAELDNARKRAQREREEYVRFANESLLRELLPVLDNFDRAIQAARARGEAEGFVTGVELIQRELLRVLEKFGVTPFSSVGQPFNAERHEAIERVTATEEHPAMTVVAETLRGYLLNGRVLRPAMVTVAVPPEPAGTPEEPRTPNG